MKIEVIISTVNMSDPITLIKRINIKSDTIIINQCNHKSIKNMTINNHKIRIYSVTSKGISNSHNEGLKHISSNTDIVLFADDNIRYVDNYKEIVIDAYKNNSCDIITFNIARNDGRKVKVTPKHIGYITSMRIQTPAITINNRTVKLKFDNEFGTGSKYMMGEENIYLYDALKKHKKIIKINKLLCIKNNIRPSTWYKGIDGAYLYDLGAAFARMTKKYSTLLIIQYTFRKYKEYNMSMYEAYKTLKKGQKDYLKTKL